MRKFILLAACLLVLPTFHSKAQCPLSLECSSTEVLCDLTELDSFVCINGANTLGVFPTNTLCNGNGVIQNISWFGFIGNGNDLVINFHIDKANCQLGSGIQAGIFERYCNGSVTWDCTSICQTSNFSLGGITKKWETYYVWINGCNQDRCEFLITVDGTLITPSLPDSLDKPTITGTFCPGGTVNICYPPTALNCTPQFNWYINDTFVSDANDYCLTLQINEDTPPGTIYDIKTVMGIGNPNPNIPFCDSAEYSFSTPPTTAIDQRYGDCILVCPSEQPYTCPNNGIRTTEGCSIRVYPKGETCLVDSIYPVILLPDFGMGSKDTVICDPNTPYIDENGVSHLGEVCAELITFPIMKTHPDCPGEAVLCDTSYTLNIARFDYVKSWDIQCTPCSGEVDVCADFQYLTRCPIFAGRGTISLDWYEKSTGLSLGNTNGNGCVTVERAGEYCVRIHGDVDGTSCSVLIDECIFVSPSFFGNTDVISEDTVICQDSVAIYTIDALSSYCQYEWRISNGQGHILTPNAIDSNSIRVQWSTLWPDTAEICVRILSDCYIKEECFETTICPFTTGITNEQDEHFYFSPWEKKIIGRDLGAGDKSIEVFSSTGQPVMAKKFDGPSFEWAASQLAAGVYYVRMHNDASLRDRVFGFVIIH